MDALLGALRDQGKPAVLPQLEVRATCQVMPGADEVFELTHQLCFAPALARAVRARLCELLGEAHPSLEVEVRPDRRTGIASLRVIPAANHSGGIGALEYAH